MRPGLSNHCQLRRPGAVPPAAALLVILLMPLLTVSVAQGQALTAAVLVGPSLEDQPIKIVALETGQLQYFDAQRRLQSIAVNKLVQLRAIAGHRAAAVVSKNMGVLTLVDGQRLVGRWAGAGADGRTIRWKLPAAGQATVRLEQLKSIRFAGSARTAPYRDADTSADASADVVTMINGDQLKGFVDAIDNEAVHITPGDRKKSIALPLKRVTALVLANAVVSPRGQGQMLDLADGTRLLAERLSLDGDGVSFINRLIDAGRKRIALGLDRIAAVDFVAGGYRLVGLGGLPRKLVAGGKVFGLAWPVRAADQTLHLHAPVTLKFRLPQGAVRVAADVALVRDRQASAAQRRWADCRLVVSAAGRTQQVHLDDGHARGSVNMPLSGPSLTLAVQEGLRGPILDRVVLTRAVVLLKENSP